MTHQSRKPGRIVDQLEQDAQALEARMLPAHGELNEQHIDSVRAQVTAYCERTGKKINQLAREIRCPVGSLLKFMQQDYDSMMDDFARRVDRFLKTHEDDSDAHMPTQMVMTGVVTRINSVIKQAVRLRSMAIILGPGGTSKTLALKAAADYMIPGSIYIEFSQAERSPSIVMKRIAESIGVSSRYRTAESFGKIVDAMTTNPRTLLIDQADYLSFTALNVFRDIHKRTGCPVVLCGTEDLGDTLKDENPLRSQFARLISNKYNITDECLAGGRPLYTVDEVISFATEMNLKLTLEGASEASDYVNILGWGGLGKLAYLLLAAHAIARLEHTREQRKSKLVIGGQHIRWALEDMEDAHGLQLTDLRRAENTSQAKVKSA